MAAGAAETANVKSVDTDSADSERRNGTDYRQQRTALVKTYRAKLGVT
jgi:hypothetical protein